LEPWAERFAAQVEERCAELEALAPWLRLLTGPEAGRLHARLAGRWDTVTKRLSGGGTLAELTAAQPRLTAGLAALAAAPAGTPDEADWLRRLAESVNASSAGPLLARYRRLAGRAEALAAAMDFRFLYKPDRHLFAIGYNVPQGRLDVPCYDL